MHGVRKMEFDSSEDKTAILGYIGQWQNSIHDQLYQNSRNSRITFREEMRRRGIKELSDTEDHLIKRQRLIQKSWG